MRYPVSAGTSPGSSATASPSTTSSTAIPRLTSRFLGTSFSIATRAAMKTIHVTLIAPSANSAAISAQQQPTHQAPCSSPSISAPPTPSRQRSVRIGSSGPYRILVKIPDGFEYTGDNEEAETALATSLKVRGGDQLDFEHTNSHSSMAFVRHEGRVPAAA